MNSGGRRASGTPEQTIGPPGRTSGLPEQMRIRLAKLDAIRAAGAEPYPVGFPRTATIAQYASDIQICRRERRPEIGSALPAVMLYRGGGKLCFATVRDGTGDIQS